MNKICLNYIDDKHKSKQINTEKERDREREKERDGQRDREELFIMAIYIFATTSQINFVNMQENYVYIQYDYVHMQVTDCLREFSNEQNH